MISEFRLEFKPPKLELDRNLNWKPWWVVEWNWNWKERNWPWNWIEKMQILPPGESLWHHQMKIFSALLALCAGISPVPGDFPSQRPVTRSFDVFFDLRPNKRLSKLSRGWWFETPSRSLCRHCNEFCHHSVKFRTESWVNDSCNFVDKIVSPLLSACRKR